MTGARRRSEGRSAAYNFGQRASDSRFPPRTVRDPLPLGAGGMGEVYRARDTRLDRIVAIKVLPEQLTSSPEQRERLEREARTISQLSHPHICALYDMGERARPDFLVMEYLEGETLADRLERARFPSSRSAAMARRSRRHSARRTPPESFTGT